MSETKTLKQDNAIEAKKIELTIQNIKKAALNLDQFIEQVISKKYPDKVIKYPSKEEAKNGKHKGWEMLAYVPETESMKVVTSMDDATCTIGNVLCWRDIRIQQYIDSEEQRVRNISNMKAQGENSSTQAQSLQNTLAQMSGGKIKAKPLDDSDE